MSKTYKDHDEKRMEHMARRRQHGLTYREIAEEFNNSKSKVHRDINREVQEDLGE